MSTRKKARNQDPLLAEYTRVASLFGKNAGTVVYRHKEAEVSVRLVPHWVGGTVAYAASVDTDDGTYFFTGEAFREEVDGLRAGHSYAFGGVA